MMMMMTTSEPCDHGDANNKVEDATGSSVFVSTEDSSSTSNLPLTGLLQIFSIDSEDSNSGGRSNKNSNPTAIYNIPGGLENDPELIRGEMMFYNTPSTEKYSELAYDSLINIQNQCSVDYDYFCGAQQFEPVSINDIMTNMFSSPLLNNFFNRRLSSSNADFTKPLKSGADYVHFIRSELSKRTNLVPASPLSSLFFRSDLTHSLKNVMDPSSSPLKDFKAPRITDRMGSNSVARIHSTVVNEKKVSPAVIKEEDTGVRSTVQRRAAPGWVKPEDVEVSTAVEQRVLSGADDAAMDIDVSQLKDESNYGDSFNVFDLLYQDGDLSAKPLSQVYTQSSLYPWDQRNVMVGAVSSSDSSSGEDSSSSIHGDKHSYWGFGADKEHDRHHRPPRQEDTSFAGNLGFGADGDMCLYRNMDRLSASCSSAVADLYMLRESYWQEYQDQQHGPHPPLGCGLLAIGLLAVVFLARRYFGYKRQQQVRSLLTALHTHPDLKARVESETGVSVPMPYTGHCCRASNASTGTCPFRVCKLVLCRLVRVLLFFAFLLLSSLFITVSSLELTFMMLQLIDAGASQDPVTGDLQLTSPFVALLILFSICAAQLSVLAVIIRAIKRCMVSRCQESTRPPSPSAPVSEDGSSATPPSSAFSTSKSVQYYLTSLPAALWDHHSSSSRPSEVYTPLLSQEDKDDDIDTGDAKMIAMTQTTSTAKPQLPQYAMVVPLTARPVNSISMV